MDDEPPDWWNRWTTLFAALQCLLQLNEWFRAH
jgi:hypothetical protein